MEVSWQTVAAVWGAGLSTVLAWLKIAKGRPVVWLEPPGQGAGAADLLILNRSDFPIVITDIHFLPRGVFQARPEIMTLRDTVKRAVHGGMNFNIPPGHTVRIDLFNERESWLLGVVRWAATTASAYPKLPIFIVKNRSAMDALKRTVTATTRKHDEQ